jgi:membrane protein YqaA with SNARE-associated domain
MKDWFKKLHIWSLELADTKWGASALFIFAFADASFLPLPTSTFFLLLIALNIKKVPEYIVSGTLGTLTGAFAAYIVGHFAWFDPNGQYTGFVHFLFNHIPGFTESGYNDIHILYTKWGFWLLCIAAATPIPYGIFSVFSGVFEVNVFIFLFATFISQGIKFTLLALVSLKLGPVIRNLTPVNWKPVTMIITVFNITIIFISNFFKNLL